MIRAGHRADARTHRIAFRDFCESPIWTWWDVSPRLLLSRLTAEAAIATHSRLELLSSHADPAVESPRNGLKGRRCVRGDADLSGADDPGEQEQMGIDVLHPDDLSVGTAVDRDDLAGNGQAGRAEFRLYQLPFADQGRPRQIGQAQRLSGGCQPMKLHANDLLDRPGDPAF